MTTEQLRYFLMLADCLNYSTAAERLFVSASTLSRAISAFEAEIQTKLFVRSKNRVSLTQAGRLMYERAPDVLEQMQSLELDCRELGDGFSGRLDIGVPEDQQVNPWIIRAGERFRKAYPNISLIYNSGSLDELKTRVVAGTCDVLLSTRFGGENVTTLNEMCYALDEPVVVVPQTMAAGLPPQLTAAELAERFAGVRCMLPKYAAPYWQRTLAPYAPKMQLWPMVGRDRTTVLTVCVGEAITLTNRWSAFCGMPTVRCIGITGLPDRPHLTALCAHEPNNPAARSYCAILAEQEEA